MELLNLKNMTFITGMLISIAGFLLIIFREKVQRATGNIGFAEQYLGSGGTYTLFLILGVVLFFGGISWATGTVQTWFSVNLGRFFGHV
jgi:hypothetical protein